MTFGMKIREMRVHKELSQRDLAQLVDIDFTYLSKIENDKVPPPSKEVIQELAAHLDTDVEELLALAAKVDLNELRDAVSRDPRIGILFRKLQSKELTSSQVNEMIKIATEKEG